MVTGTGEAIEVVERFLSSIKNANINIERAILFGSYVKGNAWKWSDIDVALVSPDFSGIRFNDSKMLIPFILKSDTRIEPHPFKPEDFTEGNDFVREIIKSGVELNI